MAHAISSRSTDGVATATADHGGASAAASPAAAAATARFRLQYDLEWLSILQRSHAMMPVGKRYPPLPAFAPPVCREHAAAVLQALRQQRDGPADVAEVGATAASAAAAATGAASSADVGAPDCAPHPLAIPLNFCTTVPIYSPPYPGAEHGQPRRVAMPGQCGNPQHDALLRALGLAHNGTTIAFSAEQAAAAAAAAAAGAAPGSAGGEHGGRGGGGRRGGRDGGRDGGRGGGHRGDHAGPPMPWQAGAHPMHGAVMEAAGPVFPPPMMMMMPGGLPFPMPPPHIMMGGQALPFPMPPGVLPPPAAVPQPAGVVAAGSDHSAASVAGSSDASAASGSVRSRLSLPPPVHSAAVAGAAGTAGTAAAPAVTAPAVPQRPAPATFDPSEIDLDF